MITKYIKLIAINIVIFFSFQSTFADELIYPKKKPILSSETLQNKILKSILIPPKKPFQIENKEIVKVEKITKKEKIVKINGIIIPKNKPLVVRKQSSRTKKTSKYYSDRDYAYAKQAIKFMEKSNWKDATKIAKKS